MQRMNEGQGFPDAGDRIHADACNKSNQHDKEAWSQEEDKNRHRMILKTPASWNGDMWREVLATGNGEIGLGIHGGVKDEVILINHGALWHWGKRSELPDVRETLKRTRELLDQGAYLEANALSSQALRDKAYVSELFMPCPVADLHIRMHGEEAFHAYQRVLDMETGEVEVSWRTEGNAFRRRVFSSRAEDLIVCHLSSERGDVDCSIWPDLHRTGGPDEVRMEAQSFVEKSVQADGSFSCLSLHNDDDTDFGLVLRVLADGGTVTPEKDGVLQVRGATEALLLAKVFVRGTRAACVERLKKELLAISDGYGELLGRHAAVHRDLYHSAELFLSRDGFDVCNEQLLLDCYGGQASPVLLEKLWRFSRHLFICGTREHAQPFPLYGLWGGRYDLCWSHHMANINIQMMYWHAMTGGLVSLMHPFLQYYTSQMADFRENARCLFGQQGICLSAGSTPGLGLANQVVPVITNWIGGAGWISRHFYETWLYTGDETLLREMVAPFMLAAADFYEGYLVRGEDGCMRIYPSVSPENTPGNLNQGAFSHMSHRCPTAQDATMDHAIVRELFSNLLEVGEAAGFPPERMRTWEALLAAMPPYRINAEGAVSEWLHPDLDDFYYHRHLSHLYPVFPGQEVDRARQPELMDAFEKAVERRVLGGQSGWSLAQMANLYARFERGEKAAACLDILCSACLLVNFFTLHNDWRSMGLTMDLGSFAPVQLDALLGSANALQEMLLHVSKERIRLLPACPKRLWKGEYSDFRFQTGRLSLSWDRNAGVLDGTIFADRPTDLLVQFPTWVGDLHLLPMSCIEPVAQQANGGPCYRIHLPEAQTLRFRTSPANPAAQRAQNEPDPEINEQ
jgi:alpha-L-fucosidase 2